MVMWRILCAVMIMAMASPLWAQRGPGDGPGRPGGPGGFPGDRREFGGPGDGRAGRGPGDELAKLKAELQKLQARLNLLEVKLSRSRDRGMERHSAHGSMGPGGFGRAFGGGRGFGTPSMRGFGYGYGRFGMGGFGHDYSRSGPGGFGRGFGYSFGPSHMSWFGPGFGGPQFGHGPHGRTGGRMEGRGPRVDASSFERRLDRIQKELDDLRHDLHDRGR
jgi:hypothetical protein